MGMSDKDKCFEKAIDKVEDVGKQKIGVENQAPWVKDLNGTWRQIPKDTAFQSIMGSIKKTLGIQSGNLPANARLPGKPDPIQVRYPDVTVDTPGGKVVIDNKFTNGKGGIDPWGSKPGTGGNTQLPDYNDINQKNTGNPNARRARPSPSGSISHRPPSRRILRWARCSSCRSLSGLSPPSRRSA